MLLQLLLRNVTQSAYLRIPFTQQANAFVTFFAPSIVLTSRKFMSYHGVANHQAHVRRNGNKLAFKGAAIQLQGMIGPAQTRNELIHDAYPGTHECVLCTLAELRHL